MRIAAPIPRIRCAPTTTICSRSSFASASWSTSRKRDLSTTILGEPAALPLILAPVGLFGMQHGDGEIHACRAAQAAGIPFTQSTMSICSIEDIAAAVDKPFWFQLYVMKDRGFIKALIERADRREMQRAGADGRSAGDRPASPGHQERHDGAAGMVAVETDRFRHQAGLGFRRAARQAPHLRQSSSGHVKNTEDITALSELDRVRSSTPR